MRANLTPQEKQSMIDMLMTLTDEMLSVLWKTITSNSGGISGMDPDLLKAFYDEFERRPGLLESMTNESKRRNTMRISKRQLKQIIREEYTRLKRQGLIKENHRPNGTILDLASQPGGVHIDELVSMFGEEIFETIDELEASGLIYMEDDGTVISLRGY